MNYYEHHIGDYAQATAHLSLLEDGVYGRLLRWYYAEEKALPASVAAVERIARAITKQEKAAVASVLKDFFYVAEDGYRQSRCDKEIERYKDKRAKSVRSAEVRWSNREAHSEGNANAMRTHSEGNANAMRTQCEGNALQTPDTRHQTPDTNNQDPPLRSGSEYLSATSADRPPPPASDPCPHQKIIDLYHELLPELPEVKVWNKTRQALLRQRWREEPSLDDWRKFFEYVKQSQFLTGRAKAVNGSPPFVADLEWLIRPNNVAKIIEGKYHRG